MSTLRGTAYEQASLRVLQGWLRMSVYRTGGANDSGMDLCGWWAPHRLSNKSHAYSQDQAKTRVIVQCKALAKPVGPSIVRELEGTLIRAVWNKFEPCSDAFDLEDIQPTEAPLIGVLTSLSGFSKQSMLQAQSSRLPMLLLHLTSPHADFRDMQCTGFIWNQALAQGILQKRFDVAWIQHTSQKSKHNKPEVVLYHDGIAVA